VNRIPVVHIITKLEFGGAQLNTLYTAASMDRDRFRAVLVTGPDGYLMPRARELDVKLAVVPSMERAIGPRADLAAYREIAGILGSMRTGPAVVHTHSSKAGILGRWAAHKCGYQLLVHSIHGFGFTPAQSAPARFLLKAVERYTSRITDHFICVSESNRREGIRLGLFEPTQCSVIRSGFDLERFREARPLDPDILMQLGVPRGSPLVLMVACLKPQKAPLDFVRIAAIVHREVPDARFLIAGDGELRDALSRESGRLGLEKILLMPGWREDVPELMKSSTVVVLTSKWEGLPRVIPQAKAAGRPVVATAVDGSPEAVREGVDGYLCDAGDVDSIAGRLILLLKDPGLARRMGQEGCRNVDEFDQDIMVRKQEELYWRLLKEKGLC